MFVFQLFELPPLDWQGW